MSEVTRQTVLVVEDEYFLADDIAAALRSAGAEVLGPVATVGGGMSLLEGHSDPDLALLDINLRGDRVFPLVDELRNRGVRVVFTTGYDSAAIPPGYQDIPRVEKPFDARQLLGLIKA